MDGPTLEETAFNFLAAHDIRRFFPGFEPNSVYQAQRLHVRVLAKPNELKEDELEGSGCRVSRHTLSILGHLISKCSFVLQESMIRGYAGRIDQNHMTYTHVRDHLPEKTIHFLGNTTIGEGGKHHLSFTICTYRNQKRLVYATGTSSLEFFRSEAPPTIQLPLASRRDVIPEKSANSGPSSPQSSDLRLLPTTTTTTTAPVPSTVGASLPAATSESANSGSLDQPPVEQHQKPQRDPERVLPDTAGITENLPISSSNGPHHSAGSATPTTSSTIKAPDASNDSVTDEVAQNEKAEEARGSGCIVEARNLQDNGLTSKDPSTATSSLPIVSNAPPAEAVPRNALGAPDKLVDEHVPHNAKDRAATASSSILRRHADGEDPVPKKKSHVSFGGFDGTEERIMRYMAVNIPSPNPENDKTVEETLKAHGITPKNMSFEPLPITKKRRFIFAFDVTSDAQCSLMDNMIEGNWYENIKIEILNLDQPKPFYMKAYPMYSFIELLCLSKLVAFNIQMKKDYVPHEDTTDLLCNKRNLGEALDLGLSCDVVKGLSSKGKRTFIKEVKPKGIPISRRVLSATPDY